MAAEYCFSSVAAFPEKQNRNRKKKERMGLRFREMLIKPTGLFGQERCSGSLPVFNRGTFQWFNG
jgi:hypothetical protein